MAIAKSGGSPAGPDSGVRARILKWVAFATAIIGLILGLNQVVGLGKTARERRRQVAELVSSANVQESSGNFSGAWASLEKASQIDPSNGGVRRKQEDLAMVWLESGRPGVGSKFTELADKVTPALSRAATSENRVRRADAFAHMGWADFLRSRDGVGGVDSDLSYRRSLAEDPANPYANAMLGHWTLWRGGRLEDARRYFAAALASNRAREFVRGLQLSALLNSHAEEAEDEAIRVANEIRKSGEKPNDALTDVARDRLFSVYYARIAPTPRREFLSAVPPAEHLATFQWLFSAMPLDSSKSLQRDYWQAMLEEAAGQTNEALQHFRALRLKLPPETSSRLTDSIDAAIQRLSGTEAHKRTH
jgi:tetratricopeptide (TPR) repeat protein